MAAVLAVLRHAGLADESAVLQRFERCMIGVPDFQTPSLDGMQGLELSEEKCGA